MKLDLIPFAEKVCQKRLDISHVFVRQHNEEVAHFAFKGTARRDNIHSASKSILSMATGIAMEEGLLDLDSRPTDILSRHLPKDCSTAWEPVTLRHLLTMTSGHTQKLLNGYSMDPNAVNRDDLEDLDWIRYIFTQPPAKEPGSLFVYNNACPYLIGRMIEEKAQEHLLDWLRPRLFVPMNIRNPQWLTDPLGNTCGAGGLQLTPEELSRFGQLCLDQGRWEGKQLVPQAYMAAAVSKQVESENHYAMKVDVVRAGDPDFSSGYGYLFWKAAKDDIYYMYGWASQLCVMIPQYDACVVTTAYEFSTQTVLDLIWEYILPQLGE